MIERLDLGKRLEANEAAVKEYYRTHGKARSLVKAAEDGDPQAIEILGNSARLFEMLDAWRGPNYFFDDDDTHTIH
jgi:hypothetical protein